MIVFNWITPLAILAMSWLVGIWCRRYLMPRLVAWSAQTSWEGDGILIRALRGSILLWCVMAGLYLAMKFSPISENAVEVAGSILKAAWIFSAAWAGANAIEHVIAHHASKWRLALPMTSLTQHLAKFIVLALGLLIILDSLGVKIGSLLTALGIGSLAVALGLQDTLANFFAGVYVTLSKHITVGDYIKLDSGQEGYVADIGWRATKIHILPGSIIIVPNAKLSQSVITNYYLPSKELAVLVDVGVEYGSDLERVDRITREVPRDVMQTVPGGVPTFEPMARFHTFGESSVQFTVVMRAKEFVDQYLLKHEFIKRLHARYAKEGIAIPSTVRTIQVR